MEYIVVQAGGMGTRLKQYTTNKPKAIVPINNLPMIFHLFNKYPDSRFIIIADYKKEVLEKYLSVFSNTKNIIVDTDSYKGTNSGISNALKIIPDNKQFMLIWSDLVLDEKLELPEENDENFIGISNTFPCRWGYEHSIGFKEENTSENGVAGIFIFKNKKVIENVPKEGEFVKWLSESNIKFKPFYLNNTAEYGLIDKIKKPTHGKCRPFNSITTNGKWLTKTGITEQGKQLAQREVNWYIHVKNKKIPIPQIISYYPLTMEKIEGKNIFEYNLSFNEKQTVLKNIMDGIKTIHEYDTTDVDYFSIRETYYTKTINRINKVRDLIPFANQEYITINNKKCKNVFYMFDTILNRIKNIQCKKFCLIHGDCTFSNIILAENYKPIFIDPRGYFGYNDIIGDPLYDWAKLYYSIVGNYDQFNLDNYSLSINSNNVILEINSNGWEDMESEFFNNLPAEVRVEDVKFVHALIWLALTTYAWDNYDSICGAFYRGLYLLEDAI